MKPSIVATFSTLVLFIAVGYRLLRRKYDVTIQLYFRYVKIVGDTTYNHVVIIVNISMHFNEIPVNYQTTLCKKLYVTKNWYFIAGVLPTRMSQNTVICLHIAVLA